jgi:hypothetical protein
MVHLSELQYQVQDQRYHESNKVGSDVKFLFLLLMQALMQQMSRYQVMANSDYQKNSIC